MASTSLSSTSCYVGSTKRAGSPLSQAASLWLSFLFAFGTPHFSAAAVGGVWFAAHVIATTCFILALIVALKRTAAWPAALLAGLLFGTATMSRLPILLAAPVLFTVLWHQPQPRKNIVFFLLPLTLILGFYGLYNHLRFGSPLDTGVARHQMHPRYIEDVARYGFFSLHYAPLNLYYHFLHPFRLAPQPPFFHPDPEGNSLFLVTPALFLLLTTRWPKNPLVISLGISCVLTEAPAMLYMATGWIQFGHRFAMDYMPLLFILLAFSFSQRLSWVTKALAVLSVLINVIGTSWLLNIT